MATLGGQGPVAMVKSRLDAWILRLDMWIFRWIFGVVWGPVIRAMMKEQEGK